MSPSLQLSWQLLRLRHFAKTLKAVRSSAVTLGVCKPRRRPPGAGIIRQLNRKPFRPRSTLASASKAIEVCYGSDNN